MSRRRANPVDEVVCRLAGDDRTLNVFHCTPERYLELALGWMIGEGMVALPLSSAAGLDVGWDDHGPMVHANAFRGAWPDAPLPDATATSGAGVASAGDTRAAPPADFSEIFRDLYARAARYHDTGGIHAAAIVE